MAIINNLELKEGMYISVVGMEVKNDNGLYMVKSDYALEGKYAVRPHDEICVIKVKLNGEVSTTKYNLNFISEKSYQNNKDLKIKIVTDLKKAKKEVNEYMKNREDGEKVVTFKETNKSIEKGSIIQFKKHYKCGTFGEVNIGTRIIWEVIDCNNRLAIREVGKKGQRLATARHLGLNNKCLEQILNEDYIVVLEKVETIKAEIKETKKVVEKVEVTEEVETTETIEEIKEVETVEENKTNDTKENTIEKIEDVKIVMNEEKNGIELYFNNKPSEEVRDNLKSNGFRWSRYNKCWYAKQTEDTIKFANSLSNTTEEEIKVTSQEYKEEKEKEIINRLAEINIDDIETYTVNEEISKRENQNGFFRSKDINHTEEIQKSLLDSNNLVIEVLKDNDDINIEYNLKMALQRFKRDYHSNYVAIITHKANNPSWAVTGRSGRNVSRDQKMNSRYDKMMFKSNELIDNFNKQLRKAENQIKRNKEVELKKELEKGINNISSTVNDYGFKRVKKDYNFNAIDYIFNNVDTNKSMITLEDQFFIFKNYGSYRIYDAKGKELYNTKTTGTLEDAKKWLIYFINNKMSA